MTMNWIDNFMKKVFGMDRVGEINEPGEITKYLVETAIRDEDNLRFKKRLHGSERLVSGDKVWAYFTKDFTPGCKIKMYIDGDTGIVETTYYNVVNHSGANHLQLSVGVKWDSDGSKEMYSHATLASCCCITEVPDDYKAHLDDMKQRRERLAKQYNVPFKSLRDE